MWVPSGCAQAFWEREPQPHLLPGVPSPGAAPPGASHRGAGEGAQPVASGLLRALAVGLGMEGCS